VAPDAPGGLTAFRLEVVMPQHQVVEIGDLERGVKNAQFTRQLGEEQGVVIGRLVAPVSA